MNGGHRFTLKSWIKKEPRASYKGPWISQRQFGEKAAFVLKSDWSATRKLGEICRLARVFREMTAREAANAAGCAPSYVSRLQSGYGRGPENYASLIAVVRLDGAALLQYIKTDASPPDPEQAQLLLLDSEASRPMNKPEII